MTVSEFGCASMVGPWAVIDIGTNSVRLLVADVEAGRVVPRLQALHQPRLGRGVDRAGRLDPAAAADTVAAIGDLVFRARQHDVESVTVVGTSALRDAADRQAFIDVVQREHDLPVTILSGAAEADLSFYGAVQGVVGSGEVTPATPAGAADHIFVLDVGGGSTELVRGAPTGQVLTRTSADVGAVRMTELCITSDPPSDLDWACLAAAVRRRLAPMWQQLPSSGPCRLIGVGGTLTTLAAIDLQLPDYDRERIHCHRLEAARVALLLDTMRQITVTERRLLPGMQARADIIVAGAFIVQHVMRNVGVDHLTVSESDLLTGVVLRQAAGQPIG